MQKIKAMFTLIRFPNLVFIFLTQFLVWQEIIRPYLVQINQVSYLEGWRLAIIALSTLLIAAAGYMINDYFDIGIDAVNKPERVTIEKIFKRRTIIFWHIVLNLVSLLLVFYVAFQLGNWRLFIYQLISILLLLVYSTTFKRKLITGNIIIAVLNSLSLFVIAVYEINFPLSDIHIYHVGMYWLYIVFAFLITLAREIVKDIEDIKGDGSLNCKTIPLVWGVQVAKNVVFTITSILIMLLIFVMIRTYDGHHFLSAYWMIFLIGPLCYVMFQLHKANTSIHFHKVSSLFKWITLAGILSMFLI